LADQLFVLGLTMYSRNHSFESIIYNSFSQSYLDERVSLHPEQLNIIDKLKSNDGVILSAPTSFGKTFVVFEYIAREKPQNLILIVPTLALVDEYNKKIIKQFQGVFKDYNVFLTINEEIEYNFNEKNIFILTHDRVVEKVNYSIFPKIDFLVIDEVYKLQRNENNDRVLVLNLAYYHLVKKAVKYLLLAPFIGGIENIDKLEKKPLFYKSNFSPVVNQVKTYDIANVDERNEMVCHILKKVIPETDKTMVYFPTVTKVYDFTKKYTPRFKGNIRSQLAINFIDWVKNEIHEEWYLVKAMENGFLIHNGQLPIGIRMFQLDLYENEDSGYSKLLCTSTLLEGVNTSAKHVIITEPTRGNRTGTGDEFDAFDFYNLVGRSGRLFHHYLGIAHYIKSPMDPTYCKEEAIKSIEFEITEGSQDINIHTDNVGEENEYQEFLNHLNITHDQYKEKIGCNLRFQSILKLFNAYHEEKDALLTELDLLLQNPEKGRKNLVGTLYKIFEGKSSKLYSYIVNRLIDKKRTRLKTTINNVRDRFSNVDIDFIITTTLRLKSSYIEYDFYSKLCLLIFFMECEEVDTKLINIIEEKIKKNIEFLYYTESISKKILKDLGIYEHDIDYIIRIIGNDFVDAFELKKRLSVYRDQLSNISIVSKYIIDSLV
jgi:hypothetical protein